jgi:RND superfamily putative drug exporter
MFERLAGAAYRRRWRALVAWVVVLAAVTAIAQVVGPQYHNDFSLPGAESQRALDELQRDAPAESGATIQVVLRSPGGLAAPAVTARVEPMLGRLAGLPHVVDVHSPYRTPGAVSADGTIGYATVTLDAQSQDVPAADVRRIIDGARAAAGDGLQVELGGDPVRGAQESSGGASEGVGLLAAVVIMVLLFGSLLAASLPIIIAVFAVGAAIGLVALASRLATVADFTVPLMILVGLGVGIDYALLVFSRYRSELIDGRPGDQAVRRALDTAGRTVFFAGCTVIVALLGLVVLGLGSLQGVAVAVALTVLVTMLAALTLLPALLAVFGARIERSVRRRTERAARRAAERGTAPRTEGSAWRRWSAAVQRRPLIAAVLPTLALLALSVPLLDMRLGFADAGTDPAQTTTRKAYDLLSQGFGPGFNGPLVVVVRGDRQAADTVRQALSTTPGVAAAVMPQPAATGNTSVVIVFPASAPQAAQTTELVQRLRDDVLPPVASRTGATFLVGGSTAAVVDFAGAVADRLPAFVIVVVGVSALLLMLVFRSLLIPVKAALLNLLSVGAALGVVTLVFQEGALGMQPGPVEAYVPVMIFAIVFGLSMDYEVFLLARMHEAWRDRRDAGLAITEGLATTGRVVTAAAAIMVVVFGAFLLSPDRMLRQFGLGLAVAVLLDAVVIRCLIVPAVMQLFGSRAWWLPAPFARRLPEIALEHH